MEAYWEALCSPQTWFFTVIMTVGVIGLAKSYERFKKKKEEKPVSTESPESN
jgi:hypothetical protein